MPLFIQPISSIPPEGSFQLNNVFVQDGKLIFEYEDINMATQSFELNPNSLTTGEEVRDAILGLADNERLIVTTRPTTGEFKIITVSGRQLGNAQNRRINIEYDDVPEP